MKNKREIEIILYNSILDEMISVGIVNNTVMLARENEVIFVSDNQGHSNDYVLNSLLAEFLTTPLVSIIGVV